MSFIRFCYQVSKAAEIAQQAEKPHLEHVTQIPLKGTSAEKQFQLQSILNDAL